MYTFNTQSYNLDAQYTQYRQTVGIYIVAFNRVYFLVKTDDDHDDVDDDDVCTILFYSSSSNSRYWAGEECMTN